MSQTKRKGSHLGLIVIVGTLATVFLILIIAIAIFLFSTRLRADENASQSLLIDASPLTMIETDKIDPALALASLGGVPEAEIIVEAVKKERPETALAALLFQPDLSDRESAGDFLLLARAYIDDAQTDKAVFSYQMAGTIATLSPDIPDTVQADIFLQVGESLINLNEPVLAKFYLDQAFIIATRSPFLRAAQRRILLERLQKNYITLNERELARQSLDLSANPPDLDLRTDEVVELPSSGEGFAIPQSLQEAEANRWFKAQELEIILVNRGGHATSKAIQSLREALLTEDREKLPFYESELADTAQLSKKIELTRAKIAWLSIKYRIARKGYGLSLVPEWETEAEQIRADLTKTYEQLFSLYADLTVALPEASQLNRATEQKLRREILAGEVGRYPNYPEEQRRKQLLDITSQLIAHQPELKIFVGITTVNNQEMYTLQVVE
ncbi:MAG: hypothetical protein JXM69_04550 [Anaerolineae bacterium]|nr:hypothetical protein [Anaerolineae bacterium]